MVHPWRTSFTPYQINPNTQSYMCLTGMALQKTSMLKYNTRRRPTKAYHRAPRPLLASFSMSLNLPMASARHRRRVWWRPQVVLAQRMRQRDQKSPCEGELRSCEYT
jgi:hypothetical protein